MSSLDVVLIDAPGREAWRGPLPPHVRERLVADAHLDGVLAGALPNDGAPVRLDRFALEMDGEQPRLRVVLGAGDATWAKSYVPVQAVRDDVEVLVAQLLAAKALDAGTYRFRCVPAAPAPDDGGLPLAPLPRRLPRLPLRSLWELGLTTPPRCRHPALLLPRVLGERLVAQARGTADVEVGALLVVAPYLISEPVPCRLAVRVLEVVPLAHGTTGTAPKLRITPDAVAAVPVDEERGRCRGGVAHSHICDDTAEPHFLSADDKQFATAFFWRPFSFQCVVDPRFSSPEEALSAFCWTDGALARVCWTLIETHDSHQEVACLPPVSLS